MCRAQALKWKGRALCTRRASSARASDGFRVWGRPNLHRRLDLHVAGQPYPNPPDTFYFFTLGALVPYIVGTWGVRGRQGFLVNSPLITVCGYVCAYKGARVCLIMHSKA